MKRALVLVLALVCLFTLTSCVGNPPPHSGATLDAPERILLPAAKSACAIYTKARPQVAAFKAWATVNWNATVPGTNTPIIAAEMKATLLEFDAYVPALKIVGNASCSASLVEYESALSPLPSERHFDWDRVLNITAKVAGVALDLHQQGAF
jgi:hypothetical protein